MFEEFKAPVPSDSDAYAPRENYGHTCIVKPREYKESFDTVNGSGRAIWVDLVDLDTGEVCRNVLMMTGSLVDAFLPYLNKLVCVSWVKAVSKGGRPYATAAAAELDQLVAAKDYVRLNGDPFAEKIETIDAEPPF